MNGNFYKSGVWALCLFLFSYLSAHSSFSQSIDSLLNVYNNQTIHSFGNVYMKDGKRMSFRALGNEFEPGTARDLYIKSKKRLNLSKTLLLVSTAALVSSAILRKNEEKGGLVLLALGIGINLANFRLRQKSTELVDQAIWIRNKEILFNSRE